MLAFRHAGHPGHLFAQLNFRDVEDSDELLIVELDIQPTLVNRRGALQGGLVATLIDIAAGRLADRHIGPGQDAATLAACAGRCGGCAAIAAVITSSQWPVIPSAPRLPWR